PGAGGEDLVEPVRPQRLADLGSSVLLHLRGARAPLYGGSHALGQAGRPRATCCLGAEAQSSSYRDAKRPAISAQSYRRPAVCARRPRARRSWWPLAAAGGGSTSASWWAGGGSPPRRPWATVP